MKRWEEAGVLIDLTDRQARLLTEIGAADWTIIWRLTPFLHFLRTEPILSLILSEYEREVDVFIEAHHRNLRALFDRVASFCGANDRSQSARPEASSESLREELASIRGQDGQVNHEALEKLLDALALCFGEPSNSATLESRQRLDSLRHDSKRLSLHFERFRKVHPGAAYVRLCMREAHFNYVSAGEPSLIEKHNAGVARTHQLIRDVETFAPQSDALAQGAIMEIQREVTNVHLGLVTALGRGLSRWATVRRFAARCETFDRDHLVAEICARPGKAEAVLTLAFARYLFDSGFNPLVDAAACGLRPDVLDATSEPAIYVEAKQYENIGDGFSDLLRGAVSQTINTWARLANRWYTPEAFLLIFRRSGRPLEIVNSEVHHSGRRLYVLTVDLGPANESGSRASEPVRIDMADLLNPNQSEHVL